MHVKQDKTVKSFTLRPAALHQKCSRVAFIDRLVPCCLEMGGCLWFAACLGSETLILTALPHKNPDPILPA